jgi:hypothetical protein
MADFVKIANNKITLQKGYEANYSQETYNKERKEKVLKALKKVLHFFKVGTTQQLFCNIVLLRSRLEMKPLKLWIYYKFTSTILLMNLRLV